MVKLNNATVIGNVSRVMGHEKRRNAPLGDLPKKPLAYVLS